MAACAGHVLQERRVRPLVRQARPQRVGQEVDQRVQIRIRIRAQDLRQHVLPAAPGVEPVMDHRDAGRVHDGGCSSVRSAALSASAVVAAHASHENARARTRPRPRAARATRRRWRARAAHARCRPRRSDRRRRRVAADFRKRAGAAREHGRPRRHRLERGQAETLVQRRLHGELRRLDPRDEFAERQVLDELHAVRNVRASASASRSTLRMS